MPSSFGLIQVTSLIIVDLILDVDGDGPLDPDGGDEDLDGAVAPHQRHHRRLHERQVRQRRRRQQERLGRLGPLRERCKRWERKSEKVQMAG